MGGICFLDAVPIEPVWMEAEVMTPHYAGWSKDDPPGDWRSPTPIPFLTTAPESPFLFGLIPGGAVSEEDLNTVMGWLGKALAWAGGGAKTAVGYGRFGVDEGNTRRLRQFLDEQSRKGEDARLAERKAREAEERRATLSPIEREIEQALEDWPDRNMSEINIIIRTVQSGRWNGDDKVEAAKWLKTRMQAERQWKEASQKRRPSKDRPYQNTLLVLGWLRGE